MRVFLAGTIAALALLAGATSQASAGPIKTLLRYNVTPTVGYVGVVVGTVTTYEQTLLCQRVTDPSHYDRCGLTVVPGTAAECRVGQEWTGTSTTCAIEVANNLSTCVHGDANWGDDVSTTCTLRLGAATFTFSCFERSSYSTRGPITSIRVLDCQAPGPVRYREQYEEVDGVVRTNTTELTIGSLKLACRDVPTGPSPSCAPA